VTRQRGFTLIEIAVVLAIIGLLIGGGLAAVGPTLDRIHYSQTNTNLDQVENALLLFVVRNNRLPCPADGSLTNASNNYGREQVTAGTPASCTVTALNSVVPWVTLGLDETFSVDGWNDRIAYFASDGVRAGTDSLVSGNQTGGGAAATVAIAANAVSTVSFTSGSNYADSTNFIVSFVGGGGSGATFTIQSTAAGALSGAATLANGGSGYTVTPTAVVGTTGCLSRTSNAGITGRWASCDPSANSTVQGLAPSFPYGNYIPVYATKTDNTTCGNELTLPNSDTTAAAYAGTSTCAQAAAPIAITEANIAALPYAGGRAAYVLISHGPTGAYGWSKSGTQKSLQVASALKTFNSNGSAGLAGNLGFVQGPTTAYNHGVAYFDDIVRWRSPAMIIQLCGSGACGNP
jgi:prepilin-type N-terminal cleavage/methylation domain-containing protein